MTPLQSLVALGTKLWLDSVDPLEVVKNLEWGATGATSNPIIVSDLIKTGRFDQTLQSLLSQKLSNAEIGWQLTDTLVRQAQAAFLPVWKRTAGNDGYVSFELDPLIEDSAANLSLDERVRRYGAEGKTWSAGHPNRLIKIPGTEAGIGALEDLAAAGVPLNVTLLFTPRQYRLAREAITRGIRRRGTSLPYKSVYSIFVSRLDVYTAKHVPNLSASAQGQVGIVNAKRIWQENRDYWRTLNVPLEQEIVFASTGTKNPNESPWKYVAAFAGSDIQTNPPATNDAVQASQQTFTRELDRLPPPEVLQEIDAKVNMEKLEATLMSEGIQKFAEPQKALLALIAARREASATSTLT